MDNRIEMLNFHNIVRYFVQLILLIAFIAQTQQGTAHGENQYSKQALDAVSSILELQNNINVEQYGNVHFVLIETEQTLNRKLRTVTEIKYWSRDDKYFRLDTMIRESNDPNKDIGAHARLILGPEGYLAMLADTAQAPLTIHRWGNFEEGMARLSGYPFFHASTRGFSVVNAVSILSSAVESDLDHTPSSENENHREIESIAISKNEKVLTIQSTWNSTSNIAHSNIAFNIESGTVIDYTCQMFKYEKPLNSTSAQKKYDYANFRSIPSHHFEKLERNDGSGYSRVFETKLVDWEPVPLGVFSLEAQGLISLQPQSVWIRRFWILLIGVFMFGVVWLIKWAKHRAT